MALLRSESVKYDPKLLFIMVNDLLFIMLDVTLLNLSYSQKLVIFRYTVVRDALPIGSQIVDPSESIPRPHRETTQKFFNRAMANRLEI